MFRNILLSSILILFTGCASIFQSLESEKKELLSQGVIPQDKYFHYEGKSIGKYGHGTLGKQKGYYTDGRYGPPYILVSISKGSLNFFGKQLEYQPTLVRIEDGETKFFGIKSKGSNFLKTFISVSFIDGVFKFDLEAEKPYEIPFHPTWFRSASYTNFKDIRRETSKSGASGIQFSIYGPR